MTYEKLSQINSEGTIMKKQVYILAVGFITLLVIAACSNRAIDRDKGASMPPADKIENHKNPENKETKEGDYPPMVMVDGQLYTDMGYVNSAVKCGTADGTITSHVSSSETPQKDDESNFGKGYKYQFGNNAHINVNIDGKWIVFQNIAISSRQIPDCVANFKAKVTKTEKDRLLVSPVDIPSDFMWIFQNRQIEEIKPVSLTIENLHLDTHKKETEIKDLLGKTVQVWFDGSVTNAEPELSHPIELGAIYKIISVDE